MFTILIELLHLHFGFGFGECGLEGWGNFQCGMARWRGHNP